MLSGKQVNYLRTSSLRYTIKQNTGCQATCSTDANVFISITFISCTEFSFELRNNSAEQFHFELIRFSSNIQILYEHCKWAAKGLKTSSLFSFAFDSAGGTCMPMLHVGCMLRQSSEHLLNSTDLKLFLQKQFSIYTCSHSYKVYIYKMIL